MSDPENTTPEMLIRAADIGARNGLRYVYAGNIPGGVGDLEHTKCHNCRTILVERFGYFIQRYRLTPDGSCPDCGTTIPGRWGAGFDGQITSTPFLPGTRRLRLAQ
jgi:pyruvate formate lyase activating enzyme